MNKNYNVLRVKVIYLEAFQFLLSNLLKAEVSCSLVNVNTDFNKVFKPITYIRKMRGMARKLTSDCQNTHRDEIQAMFQVRLLSLKNFAHS